MKIDKIEITISATGCLDYGTEIDAETEAYLEAYAEAVAEAVAEEYPDAKVECELDWSAPSSSVTVEFSTIEGLEREVEATREMDGVDETVLAILQYLWDNPGTWWQRTNV